MSHVEVQVVGKGFQRKDAREKVLGKAKYVGDVVFPGMLHAKLLRSPYSHAKVVHIDTSKATENPGVKFVLDMNNAPRKIYGVHEPPIYVHDERVFDYKVRCVGDPVAAVAADSLELAEEAIEKIQVRYEQLPSVFDPDEAMKPGAPMIHEGGNVAMTVRVDRGDVQKGFQEADSIFENTYHTHRVQAATLEKHVCVSDFDESGCLTVLTSTQVPFGIQICLSQLLDLPKEKVRVLTPYVGGGFGSRANPILEPYCACLSMKLHKPVRLELSREEVFSCTQTRHPFTIVLKTGVTRDGILTARQMRLVADTGAYASHGPGVLNWAVSHAVSLYNCPNVRAEGYCVYTNNPVAGAFRGYGNPQQTFAVESQMDEIAHGLGIDPIKIRLQNAVREGDTSVVGWEIHSCGIRQCLEEGAKGIGWLEAKKQRSSSDGKWLYGLGLAVLMHASGVKLPPGRSDFASAEMKLNDDGTTTLTVGSPEIGQGSSTIWAQIAAEETGLNFEDIKVNASVDTTISPLDWGVYASRSTVVLGNAVLAAARDLKQQMLMVAAGLLGASVEEMELSGGEVLVKGAPSRRLSIAAVAFAARSSSPRIEIVGKGSYDPPNIGITFDPDAKITHHGNIAPAFSFGAQFARVAVNVETGEIRVMKFVSAHDVGKVMNLVNLEGQVQGAVISGIGYALSEELLVDDGKIVNRDFADYKMLSARDRVEIEVIPIETNDPNGPFGAKGVGEVALDATAAAIANAVYDATGIRITSLPLTREKLIAAGLTRP